MTIAANKSISRRLSQKILRTTAAIFIAAIVCVAILSYYIAINESRQNANHAIRNSVLEIEKVLTNVESASNVVAKLAQANYDISLDIRSLASDMLAANTSVTACGIALEPDRGNYGEIHRMILATRDENTGEIVTDVRDESEYDYLSMDWYQIAKLTGKSFWNEPVFDKGGSSRMIATYSIPLYDRRGRFFGVLRSDVSLEWLSHTIEKFRPYKSSNIVIVGKSGTFILHPDKEKVLNETIFTDCIANGDQKTLFLCQSVMKGEKGIAQIILNEKKYFAIYAPLENGWRAVGLCSRGEILRSARAISMSLFLIATLGLILLYRSSRKTISKMTRPITEFAYAAMNMSRGNFHVKIPAVHTNDELLKLHDSLNYLEASINDYISELKTATRTKERMESELYIASMVQKAMLIHTFPKGNADIYAELIPAKEIGGDLYDVFQDGKDIYFVVGDVSGKGVPAALYMAITRSAFRFATSLKLSVVEILSKINDNFCEGNEEGMFVTMFVAKINTETLEMEYCNAGHNPLVIVSPDGKADFLRAKPNIAAGLFSGFNYVGESVRLKKGSRLLVYTDGITEAETKGKALYGEDRLLKFASDIKPGATSREIVEGVISNVREFVSGNEQNDDITILTVSI